MKIFSNTNRVAPKARIGRTLILATAICGAAACPQSFLNAAAPTVDPRAVIAAADRARGNYSGIQWKVKIESTENGHPRTRTLVVKSLGHNSLAEFISPAKVRGRKLLMKDRSMWFVKPGLQKPVPISPRQKLIGGASNGDIASTDYAGDYEAALIGADTVNNTPCYLFDLVATTKRATYNRIRYWVSVPDSLGLKAEFYTVSDRLFKSAVFEYDHRVSIDNSEQRFISRMTISDHLIPDRITTLIYQDVKLKAISRETFNLNFLMR